MSLTWPELDHLTRAGELDELTGVLLKATEQERLAFAKEFETQVKAVPPDDWWWCKHYPAPGYALIAIACLPSVARTAALLCRREMRTHWSHIPTGRFLEIAHARRVPWLDDLSVRLAARLTPQELFQGGWPFVADLLVAADAGPPVTEGVVRGWLREMRNIYPGTPSPMVDRLRTSPHLDLLLPSLFTIDGLGSEVNIGQYSLTGDGWQNTPEFPSAVAQLVSEGRLDRRQILDATVERLVRGDRPAFLRPFALLHEALAPTAEELARHTLDYARMLPDAPSPVATLAQRALREIDDAGRVEIETLLDASRAVLVRKEKGLVKAQLTWLAKVARREPARVAEVLEAVAAALDHPSLDIQDHAQALIDKHSPDPATQPSHTPAPAAMPPPASPSPSPSATPPAGTLSSSATQPPGALPAVAAQPPGVLPAVAAQPPDIHSAAAMPPSGAPSPALPPVAPPAAMPPPIADPVELAEEVVALVHQETGVRWERVLAGIVALRTAALADVLGPILDRCSDALTDRRWTNRTRLGKLGEALHSVLDPGLHGRGWQRMIAAVRAAHEEPPTAHNPFLTEPGGVLELRIAELAVEVTRTPVPELLATPTLVNGSLDAGTLLTRLVRAEAEGRQPWPVDLEQALLRVPFPVDGTVLAEAAELTTEAGRTFAAWLAGGGLPDPKSVRFEQRSDTGRRVMANLFPARTGGLLENHLTRLERRPKPQYLAADTVDDSGVPPMVLPHHREVSAAWGLQVMACMADQDGRGGGPLLPQLTDCTGPIGPAITLGLTYVFGARHEADRVAAVDAFLALVAGGEPFAAAMGADVGDLCADGTVKLNRVVLALGDAHRAGASTAVWEVLAVAVPLLLPHRPRGLPDLLELATRVASEVGVKTTMDNLAETAARPGGARLAREARRLQATLTA